MGPRIDLPAVKPSRWLWIALVWLSIGMFDASDTVFSMRAEGHHHAWMSLFLTLLLSWVPWALATPLILDLGRRYPLELKSMFPWFPHLAACAATGLAFAAWTAVLEELLNPWLQSPPPDRFMPLMLAKFFNRLFSFLILYSSIVAIGYVLESRQRLALQETETARLNELLMRAQLDALRRQIEPHFLFNTLNGITALVREGRSDAAIKMIAALSDFLRRAAEGAVKHEVALADELEFLQKYLDIQKVRFSERLLVRVDVPEELLGAKIPSLLLQPIVENSIKHGITKRAQGGQIRIAACRSDGMLTLNIYNDGPKLRLVNGGTRRGTGIFNLRSRLNSLYGSAFKLTIQNQEPDGVEVSVVVPFREN
jgi:hypothetical protein